MPTTGVGEALAWRFVDYGGGPLVADVNLRSLAPEYKEASHGSYVRHLERAVADPRNKNIALTGRYGAGKSSILDNFLEKQAALGQKTLRISINTLGPDDDEEITNRIQKELVKQLVYRAKPGEIRHSRFARPKRLTWWRTLLEAIGVATVIIGLLWVFGVRPDADALGTSDLALPTVAFASLVVLAAWAGRWIIGDRLISHVSTGGASIEFEKRPDSYFDEYLDEIVAFFEATEPDIVVFEDLDRFDDARIFDSLRELNTLINASAHWRARDERPLRFIYAMKDSLFEKLGEEQDEKDRGSESSAHAGAKPSASASRDTTVRGKPDTAAAAIERANRTKFFEIVVPVVPFLSHSNARDLLGTVLEDLKLPKGTNISRQLLDLVARHATDMRLLINIANEFVVYAEKLLWSAPRAPGMSADDLFALVVYKNFHLGDFEALPHRGSALDTLELYRRQLVKESVERLQWERKELLRGDTLKREQAALAALLGDRLTLLLHTTRNTIVSVSANGQALEANTIREPLFWRTVAGEGELTVSLRHWSGHSDVRSFGQDQLTTLFPDGLDPMRWAVDDPETVATKRASFDRAIADLRGADFASLARDSRYTAEGFTFGEHVERALGSALAKDLVRRGFVTRYYAEHSSVFYGDFLGVDVANFFRNSVWPNEMDLQFEFETPNAIQNLLEQAPAGFTSSRSTLNIQIVDFMLRYRPELAKEVIAFLVSEQNTDTVMFLDAFFNAEGARGEELVALLAMHPWRGLLDHIAREESVPDAETRARLLSTALLSGRGASDYDLGKTVQDLILALHADLPAFTEEQPANILNGLFSFVVRTKMVVPSLRPLSAAIGELVVKAQQYHLTADNLRAALSISDDEPISLENVRRSNEVWQHCADRPELYFEAVNRDVGTPFTVSTAQVLRDVIAEQQEKWSENDIVSLLESSDPAASLPELSGVPQTAWSAIAAARRMVPSVGNLHAYVTAFGVNASLTTVLVDDEHNAIDIPDAEDAAAEILRDLALTILNASAQLTPSQRVALALQLSKAEEAPEIDITKIEPAQDDLLAKLLEAGLVPDTAATFTHFFSGGWRSVADAFRVSNNAHTFIVPGLVQGHAAELLGDDRVPHALKSKVVVELENFAPDGGAGFLGAAAAEAHASNIHLTMTQLELVAPSVSDPEHVLSQLTKLGTEFDGVTAIRTLGLLGKEYHGFNGSTGQRFEIPKSDSVNTLLTRLKNAGLVDLPSGGRPDRRKVTLI
jgi:hypothetical protein